MKISFNPSNSNKNILDLIKNNKDIIFDLKGHNIFARGVKFYGTDTWRDIKINNVSIGSNTLDLRNGSNTTLTNTNGIVTINSTWRPVVDNLTSDSTTSSLSAKQGKVLKALIDGKSDSGHNHDDRYLKLTGGSMSGTIYRNSGGSTISGRDHAIIRQTHAPGVSSWNPIACVDTETGTWTLGHLSSGDSNTNFHFCFSTNADYNAGNNNGNYVTLRNKAGTIALLSEIPDKNSWNYDDRYVKKTGDTMSGVLTIDTTNFGALTIKRNDDANGACIQFRGKSSIYGYIGLNNSTKDKQFLRWGSDTSKTYTILDTSSTYTSNGKGVINGTTITQVDNATNSTNSTNARKLVNWYSARPTSLNTQFGDGSLRIFYATSSTTESKCPSDASILHLAWDNNGGWDTQLALASGENKMYFRGQNKGTWQPWKTLAFTTDIPSSLKNPYSFNVFGVTYDGSAAKTVTTSTFISQVTEGTGTVTDGTMFITSYPSNSGFADTNAVNIPYKRKAIHLWAYIKAKTDSLYATKSHNHDDRYVRAFGTSNDNIDSDWGQSFKTFDPIPSGTPPEKNANISILNIGNNFNRRKQLAFIYNNDNIYYRRHVDNSFTNWRRLAFANEIPTSLKNPHALTISLNGTSQGPYDGSAAKNINITPGSIGAATSNHNHDGRYVYNYGGTKMDGASIDKNALGMTTSSGISGDWWHILQAAWNGEYRWNSQIAFPTQNRNGMYYRSGLDDNTAWGSWVKLLDVNNYSSTLDSRYYTESEVNNLLNTKLNRQNLSYGTWNPRDYNLAADYSYNGGDLSISESGGQIHVSVDGYFWQNEGQYRVLDTSDIGSIHGSLTLYQHLSSTDTNWFPLVWGGSDHKNTNNSTGSLYKSYDKLSWQTSSQTLYATNIQTNNIKNLSIGGGIYWNPYVELTTDGSDAASITLVKSGVTGGTTLVLSQMNDANDTIQFQTNGSARLYHNSYPILTTQNTYVSGNKGYINGTEITQVNNSNLLDGLDWNNFFSRRFYTFDLSSYSLSNFYPLFFVNTDIELDCEIHSNGGEWQDPYNQNRLHFQITSRGYADVGLSFHLLSQNNYDNNEITIGSIGIGTKQGGICIWVRGGRTYRVYSNREPLFKSSNYTYVDEIYSVGTNIWGGTNTNVNLVWKNDSTRKDALIATLTDNVASATKVIVNQHTTNDTNYPLVWSNQNNSNTVTENQLFKSWSDLYYNPKNKRLTVGGSVVASSFVKSGGTSQQLLRADGGIATFNWSGQSGQPTWLWGGNNQHSYYVYNPSNFRVAYASSAGNADTVDGVHMDWSTNYTAGNYLAIWDNSGTAIRPIPLGSVSIGNADKLDGVHANGLLTALSNSDKGISITVGGTTKSISNISVNYASSAGSASTATTLTTNAGNSINPVYFSGGKPIACTMSTGRGDGIVRSFGRGAYTSANQYFGNGTIVAIDPLGTGCISANDTILSLGDTSTRNTQLLVAWDRDGVYYRRITDSQNYGNWKRLAFTTDNIASATKLQTPRTIWGQSFDGTGNVDNTLRIRQTTGSYCEGIRIQTADSTWATIILGATGDRGTNANAWSIHRKADNNFAISRNSSDGTNGLVMTSVGMGLGTAAPAYRLDVRGNIYSSSTIRTAVQNKAIVLSNDVSPAWISALDGQVIFNTGNAIRFGETAWDWNNWAGLKYTHSNKTIYLGIADGSIFNANSAQKRGTLDLRAGISDIDLNSGTSIRGLPTDGSPYSSNITLRDTSISLSAYEDISMSTGPGVINLSSGYGGIKLSYQGNNASISPEGFKVEASQGVYLNSGNSGNVYLGLGGGKVGIGYSSPSYKLDVNGQMRSDGFHHYYADSNDYMLLAGGGYTSLKNLIFTDKSYTYTDHSKYNLTFHKLGSIFNNLVWVDGHVYGSTSTQFIVDSNVWAYKYDNSSGLDTTYSMGGNDYISVDASGVVLIRCNSPHRVGFFYTGNA